MLAGSLDALVAARALSGAAGAGVVPLSMAWIGDNVPYERRQATLARFLTGTILGMAAGLFADTVGWRWAFAVLVVIYLVVGTLLYRELRRQAASGQTGAAGAARTGFVAQARLVLGTRGRVSCWPRCFRGLLVFGTLAFAPSYLHARFGISLTAAGALVASYALGGLLYTLVAGHVLRRLGERGLALAGGLVLSAAFLCYWLGPQWLWSLPAGVLAGFGYYLLHATLQTNATQMVPAARGTAVAWFASCLFMGQAAGVALAGLVVDAAGAAMLFGMTALLLPLLGCRIRLGAAPPRGGADGAGGISVRAPAGAPARFPCPAVPARRRPPGSGPGLSPRRAAECPVAASSGRGRPARP